MQPIILVRGLAKQFVLHTQDEAHIPVFSGLDLDVRAGECVALAGPSGAGKSTLLRSLYGNYKPDAGAILICTDAGCVDVAAADPRTIIELRRTTLGYVSQFLRVIPRVPAIDIVAEPLTALGLAAGPARERAAELLTRLRIPERLWRLAPATFSGGEQQRVNIARGFAAAYPVLLLDEPTASLDPDNRDTVVALILEAKAKGAAIAGILHDQGARDRVADRVFNLTPAVAPEPCPAC
jgi:alpha-D-ribose 1-methylphosphonate 5-triphosphate synthase subunit PhnL